MELNQKQIKILDAAEELFAKKGFVGTSVRDIARKAGINVAMISYYFGSKDKLLKSLLIYRTQQSRDLLENLSHDPAMDLWKKLDKIVDFYVDHLLENRNFHNIMSRQISLAQDPEIDELLVTIKRNNYHIISSIIKEGQRKGLFGKVNIPLTIGSVIGTITQVNMSLPFYKKALNLRIHNEEEYFRKITPKLKSHLKSLIRSHLSIK